eukprot:3804149-Amphidinium_carterae.4
MKKLVQLALQKRGQDTLPQKKSSHCEQVTVGLEIERSFELGTLAEVKRCGKLEKLPAKSLKYVPQIKSIGETGEEETLYCFADGNPDQLRKAKIAVKSVQVMTKEQLPAELFLSLAEPCCRDIEGKCHLPSDEQSGMSNLLSKFGFMNTFGGWMEKKFAADEKDEEEEEGMAAAIDSCGAALVGPAAAAFNHNPARKPMLVTPKGKTSSKSPYSEGTTLLRLASGRSVGAASSETGGEPASEDAGSKSGYDCLTVFGDEGGSWLGWKKELTVSSDTSTWHDLLIPGGDSLAEWKLKLPLESIISGEKDMRSLGGLKSARNRLGKAGPEKESKLKVLKTYLDNCENAFKVSPANFASVGDDEIPDIIAMLQGYGVKWPETLKMGLLVRRANTLQRGKQWAELSWTHSRRQSLMFKMCDLQA